MAFQWLKNILGIDQMLTHLSTLIDQSHGATLAQLQEQKKGLRRLSLAQQQQNDALQELKAQVEQVCVTPNLAGDTVIPDEQLLDLLDDMYRIELASQNDPMASTLVHRTRDKLLQLSGWRAVAITQSPYPPEDCEVVGGTPSADHPAGTVQEVIQQGYRNANHQLIRAAKVMVYQQAQTEEF